LRLPAHKDFQEFTIKATSSIKRQECSRMQAAVLEDERSEIGAPLGYNESAAIVDRIAVVFFRFMVNNFLP